MAIEYASSPVEQPSVQTRTCSSRERSAVSFGKTRALRASYDSALRKKLVTLIRMSR